MQVTSNVYALRIPFEVRPAPHVAIKRFVYVVYDDVIASVRSIRRLKDVPDVDVLLSSWDEPRRGRDVRRVLDEGLAYLQRVHDLVCQIAGPHPGMDHMALCRQVVDRLGLPSLAANPLCARSLASHLKVLDIEDVLKA